MTRQAPNSAHPQDPDADRLSAAWNDIVEGFPPSTDGADAELIATVRSLHASAPDQRPTSSFRDELREQLMDTAVPITKPGFAHSSRTRETFIGRIPAGASRSRFPQSLRGTAVRWAAIAATIALLLTTLGAGYLGGIYPPGKEPTGTNLAAPYLGTPTAGIPVAGTPVADPCGHVPQYLPCNYDRWVGDTLIVLDKFPAEHLAVTHAQIQNWELEGSEGVAFSAPLSPVAGVGVDLVTSGAYEAEFSAPVVVTKQTAGGGSSIHSLDANAPIELGSGDAVAYQIGTKVELRNSFGSTTLQFKSILFYAGDPSPENLDASGHFRVQVDDDGELPIPLNEYPGREVQIIVTYVQLIEGYPFPPETYNSPEGRLDVVLGPAGSNGSEGAGPNQGFVVWAATPKG